MEEIKPVKPSFMIYDAAEMQSAFTADTEEEAILIFARRFRNGDVKGLTAVRLTDEDPTADDGLG